MTRYYYFDSLRALFNKPGSLFSCHQDYSSRAVAGQDPRAANCFILVGLESLQFSYARVLLACRFFLHDIIKEIWQSGISEKQVDAVGNPIFFIGFTCNTIMELFTRKHINSFPTFLA